jgi:putative ABC transport system permease protein
MLALLFGVLALVQAGVGIYGVTSYSVAQRIREIGLRMALGAQAKDVLRLIIGESMRAVIIGVMIGALGAYVTSKLIQDMLFGVSRANPMIFMLSASVMFSITLLAAFFPVRSALKTDPNKALRAE